MVHAVISKLVAQSFVSLGLGLIGLEIWCGGDGLSSHCARVLILVFQFCIYLCLVKCQTRFPFGLCLIYAWLFCLYCIHQKNPKIFQLI